MRITQNIPLLLIACLGLAPLGLLAKAEAPWSENYEASIELAKSEQKPVLMLFTGSDWCPPCKMMEARVFASADFADFARKELVLMKADYPRRKTQKAATKKQNRALADKFGVEAFPTIVVLSPSGEVLDQFTGARYATPGEFINWAKDVVKKS